MRIIVTGGAGFVGKHLLDTDGLTEMAQHMAPSASKVLVNA